MKRNALKRRMRMLLAASAIVALCGCNDDEQDADNSTAVVGSWSSTEDVVGVHNELTAEGSGSAHATLYILLTRDGVTGAGRFEFNAQWDARRNGDVEFDLACERSPFGDCTVEDDFKMDCDLSGDDNRLSCQGGGNWREYVFAWTRQP